MSPSTRRKRKAQAQRLYALSAYAFGLDAANRAACAAGAQALIDNVRLVSDVARLEKLLAEWGP